MPNKETVLDFSKRLKSIWLRDVKHYLIKERTIVVNIGEANAVICAKPAISLPPRSSTVLQNVTVDSGDSLILIHVEDKINLGGIILDNGWSLYGDTDASFSSDVPLYKSAQFDVGLVCFDPFSATGTTEVAAEKKCCQKFQVKANLWFSPENTNCEIHNHHTDPEMLEVHTQISGVGRMQKFREKNYEAIYEDVIMGAGMSHTPFAGVHKDGTFFYPWHQYFADTDCIWMAVEYHPR